MAWSAIYAVYAGGIIFTYGNLFSIGIEYLQRKWFEKHDWLHILLRGVFGLAQGLFVLKSLGESMLLYGALAALLYACVDRWIYKRASKNKAVKMFFLFPLLAYGLCWGYFQFISSPVPPFIKEEAVDFAADNRTMTDVFPNKIGKWRGTVEGYEVTRSKEKRVQKKWQKKYISSPSRKTGGKELKQVLGFYLTRWSAEFYLLTMKRANTSLL